MLANSIHSAFHASSFPHSIGAVRAYAKKKETISLQQKLAKLSSSGILKQANTLEPVVTHSEELEEALTDADPSRLRLHFLNTISKMSKKTETSDETRSAPKSTAKKAISDSTEEVAEPKKRGRPKKSQPDDEANSISQQSTEELSFETTKASSTKKRTRKATQVTKNEPTEAEHIQMSAQEVLEEVIELTAVIQRNYKKLGGKLLQYQHQAHADKKEAVSLRTLVDSGNQAEEFVKAISKKQELNDQQKFAPLNQGTYHILTQTDEASRSCGLEQTRRKVGASFE